MNQILDFCTYFKGHLEVSKLLFTHICAQGDGVYKWTPIKNTFRWNFLLKLRSLMGYINSTP